MSKFVAPKNKTLLTAEITYSDGDLFSKKKPQEIINKVLSDLIKTNLISMDQVLDTTINFEPYVYPIQFSNYKNESALIKSFIENFYNLFSIGAGGDFNYADSQILFHKSFDLAENLSNKYNLINFPMKEKILVLSTLIKILLLEKKVGEKNPVFIIAEAGLNHNGSINIAKKLIDNASLIDATQLSFNPFCLIQECQKSKSRKVLRKSNWNTREYK